MSGPVTHSVNARGDRHTLVLTGNDAPAVPVVGLPEGQLASIEYALLRDGRTVVTWRQTHPDRLRRGHQTALQDELVRRYPGRVLASDPCALSPDGRAFRDAYLAAHPGVSWLLDPSLDCDALDCEPAT